MAEISAVTGGSAGVATESYLALVARRRLYGGLTLLVFVLLLVSGFWVADTRNAGNFWSGLAQLGDFPASVLSEAWEKRADLPAKMLGYLPSLFETVNIAAVATLLGAFGGLLLSLYATRGLALWPRAIPLFRRVMDIMRAVPEIVIAPGCALAGTVYIVLAVRVALVSSNVLSPKVPPAPLSERVIVIVPVIVPGPAVTRT